MISSHNNPKVKELIQLQQKAKARQQKQVFVVEGLKMFLEAPADWIESVYVSEIFLKNCDCLETIEKYSYEVLEDAVFRKVSDTVTPQGILCVVKRADYSLEVTCNSANPLFLLLEDIRDPGNLGTIIRTGEAAGITGVIMSKETVDIYNPKTIRATMGSIYRVPFWYEEDFHGVIRQLQNRGIRTYATHLQGEVFYTDNSYQNGTAFLIGNEANGLQEDTAALADAMIKIPMEGQVESLNAAIAASLFLYEAKRQRKCEKNF